MRKGNIPSKGWGYFDIEIENEAILTRVTERQCTIKVQCVRCRWFMVTGDGNCMAKVSKKRVNFL